MVIHSYPIAHKITYFPFLDSTAKAQECSYCKKHVPMVNFELHQIHCEKLRKQQDTVVMVASQTNLSSSQAKVGRTTATKSELSSTKISKKKPSRKVAPKSRKTTDVDDLDTMLAEMTLSDSTCSFPKCKKSVNILGMQCQFCKEKFCMAHNIAEVHGCAEAAKKHARQQISKELKGGPRPTSLNAVRRSQLQAKLGKRIDELSSGRQSKKSTGSKEAKK